MKKHFRNLPIVKFLIKYYKAELMIINFIFMLAIYFYINTIDYQLNHLTYTHIFYISIVLVGSLVGPYAGLIAGLYAGILAGPLLPRDLLAGTAQQFPDWFFRLFMFSMVGLLSGILSADYQKLNKKMEDYLIQHPDSKLYNINALQHINLKDDQVYMVTTILIENYEMITEVLGYKAYYDFLNLIKTRIQKIYKDTYVIFPEERRLWILKKSDDYRDEIQNIVNIMKHIKDNIEQRLFVNFGLGFDTRMYHEDDDLSQYFISTDMTAREAIKRHILYLRYSNLKTDSRQEYEISYDFIESLENNQIFMYYQPKINLETGKPESLEALIRWEHNGVLIPPNEFIPVIEKTSLIQQLTKSVFTWVIEYHIELRNHGLYVPIAVNISAKNLYDVSFYTNMMAIFNQYDIQPKDIELEVTETVLVSDYEQITTNLQRFYDKGFKISIDDFGKGYSSLSYLSKLPFTGIKIDQAFAKDILTNTANQKIVESTIKLANDLNLDVTVEGVETVEVRDIMKAYHCKYAQGYFFKKPMPKNEMTQYLLDTIEKQTKKH
ncbi:EAL domain-containing protein [Mycoplasmatota bacterium]|nr:EAL domain-containing protein [Mycoplasmatota bacterium]